MTTYIGLDAHAATSTAVAVNEKGEMIFWQKFKTSEGNLIGFLKSIEGPKHLTFEECHLSQWLYVTLKEKADKIVVCNPRYVPDAPGPKDDFRDALNLGQQLRTNHLIPVYHDESHWIQLRVLVSGYLDLTEELVRSKNRLKAVFRSEAIDTHGSDFYETAKERSAELSHESAKFVAENLFWQIDGLEKRKREYREVLKRNMKKYKPIKNLTTVPGIDIVRASIITAIVCMPNRFRTKHNFWAYCMLARHRQMSDGRIYGNKKIPGRSELKEVFMGAAESALRTEGSLRQYYDQVRKRGIGHPEAKRSLARKISATCLSLLKNSSIFQDDYDEQQKERTRLRKELNQRDV
jgi:transposase